MERVYINASPYREGPTVVAGDFNACHTQVHGMLSSWKSLCEHHTQVECIPADQPHLVAIDGIEVFCPNDDASFHEADHLPLEKMPAFRAAENYWGIFDPLIQQRMKSHGAVAP